MYWSNRSASYASLERWEEAAADARRVVALKPGWAKVGGGQGGRREVCKGVTEDGLRGGVRGVAGTARLRRQQRGGGSAAAIRALRMECSGQQELDRRQALSRSPRWAAPVVQYMRKGVGKVELEGHEAVMGCC